MMPLIWWGQPVELENRNGTTTTIYLRPRLWFRIVFDSKDRDPLFRAFFPKLARLEDETVWWKRFTG